MYITLLQKSQYQHIVIHFLILSLNIIYRIISLLQHLILFISHFFSFKKIGNQSPIYIYK